MKTLTEAAIAAIKALTLADPAGLENALETIAGSDQFSEQRRDKTREALKRLRDEGEFAGVALKGVFGQSGPKPGTADPSRGVPGSRADSGALDEDLEPLGYQAARDGRGRLYMFDSTTGDRVAFEEFADVVAHAGSSSRDTLGRSRSSSPVTRDALGRSRPRGTSSRRDGFGRSR